MIWDKNRYNPMLVEKARGKFMKLWGELTTTEERKKAIREAKDRFRDHKGVSSQFEYLSSYPYSTYILCSMITVHVIKQFYLP